MIDRLSRIAKICGVLAALAAGILGASCSPKQPEIIPLSVILGDPGRSVVKISPDGTKISYLYPVDGVRNIFVQTIGAGSARPLSREAETEIRSYVWAMNSRQMLYTCDRSGMDNWRLYGVDVETGETRDYTPWDGLKVEIVALDKRFPDEIIIAMNREDAAALDAYRLDLRSGEIELAAKNPGTVTKWIADASLFVRGALSGRPDGGSDFLVRAGASAPWRTAYSWSLEDMGSSGPAIFAPDGKSVYCYDAAGANTARLVRLSLVDSSMTVIAEDPRVDVAMAVFDNDTAEPRLVSFDRERSEWIALAERDRAALEDVKRVDPELEFNYVGSDTANTLWLVAFVRDDGPNAYYLYDREARKATFLFNHQDAPKKYTYARMEPVTIPARDGLQLPAYLSYPPGSKRAKLPLVLRVRGNPWYRDYWGYYHEVQWLANRGYAVLQVNHRGSRGFGKEFMNAGNREIGGAMETDLIDAVNWAIEQGIADPKRIGIMGISAYGGFAALSALTSAPELFACGISVSGVVDLVSWLESFPQAAGAHRTMLYRRIGDPVADAEMLKDRSPINHLDRLASPVLLTQGGKDRYVPREHAERVVAALAAKSIPYEYLYFPDEGQGFAKGENYIQYCRAAERFLARHLGGRVEETSER